MLSYGNIIEESINKKIIALHQLLLAEPFIGFVESVPAYSSVAIFYDVAVIRKNTTHSLSAFEYVKQQIIALVAKAKNFVTLSQQNIISIPVYYNGEDVEEVAKHNHLTPQEVIAIHTSTIYSVYMIGFLPGFAYMGTVDKRIITPRKATPRLHVSAGSVGIAGEQTGIYPIASPGGWQILGSTPIKIFDTKKVNPFLLNAGNTIKFVAITKEEYEQLNEY